VFCEQQTNRNGGVGSADPHLELTDARPGPDPHGAQRLPYRRRAELPLEMGVHTGLPSKRNMNSPALRFHGLERRVNRIQRTNNYAVTCRRMKESAANGG